jgi:structural maintenance of chromosome 1
MYVSAALKKSKERFENEMSEHGSARDMQTREAEATGRISGLERKIQYAEIEKV